MQRLFSYRTRLDRYIKGADLNIFYVARFEVLTAVLAKITEFWDITPYQLTKSYRRFERTYWSRLQRQKSNKSVSSFTARL